MQATSVRGIKKSLIDYEGILIRESILDNLAINDEDALAYLLDLTAIDGEDAWHDIGCTLNGFQRSGNVIGIDSVLKLLNGAVTLVFTKEEGVAREFEGVGILLCQGNIKRDSCLVFAWASSDLVLVHASGSYILVGRVVNRDTSRRR